MRDTDHPGDQLPMFLAEVDKLIMLQCGTFVNYTTHYTTVRYRHYRHYRHYSTSWRTGLVEYVH